MDRRTALRTDLNRLLNLLKSRLGYVDRVFSGTDLWKAEIARASSDSFRHDFAVLGGQGHLRANDYGSTCILYRSRKSERIRSALRLRHADD